MKHLDPFFANVSSANDLAPAPRRVRFRLAGYLFTYRRADAATSQRQARVRIDMWREDPETGERHWITVATTAPDPKSARAAALALVAWVRWCDVGPKNTCKARAVAESFAMLRERLAERLPGATGSVSTRAKEQRISARSNAASDAA